LHGDDIIWQSERRARIYGPDTVVGEEDMRGKEFMEEEKLT